MIQKTKRNTGNARQVKSGENSLRNKWGHIIGFGIQGIGGRWDSIIYYKW